MTEQLEHRILFTPGFDKRDPSPNKNYGIGAMRITFYVIGPKGAVQWMIGTGWYPLALKGHMESFPLVPEFRPQTWGLGYHSKEPQYAGQTHMESCHLFEGGCYYDGSGLNAELLLEQFILEGEEYLWPKLEAYYHYVFESGPWSFDVEADKARAEGRYV